MPASLSQIAEKYCCSARTASRWQAEGAPLDNPKRLRVWLAGRKNLPPATKAMLASESKARRASVAVEASEAPEDSASIGAPAALRRLELAEISAYKLLQSASESGDPHEVKAAREGWLKVGDSLRRYDLMVESARRQSGESIQRDEVERHVANFVRFFKLATFRTASALALDLSSMENPADVDSMLRGIALENMLSSFAGLASSKCKGQVPDWLLAAALRPFEGTLEGTAEAVKARAQALDQAVSAMAEASASKIAELFRA